MTYHPIYDTEHIEMLKRNPREDFIQAIRSNDRTRCLIKTAEIHGHFCPGSALGVMASMWGLKLLEDSMPASDGLENFLAIVEINACFADGIQAVSGCTLGNNALIYRDLGRHAVTFAIRGKTTGIRVLVRPNFSAQIQQAVPEFYPLMEKVIKQRAGNPEEEAAFKDKGREAAFALIQKSFEELLIADTVEPVLPGYAPITESVICPSCGEMVMATKIVADGQGRGRCVMCAGRQYRQLEGQGITLSTAYKNNMSLKNYNKKENI